MPPCSSNQETQASYGVLLGGLTCSIKSLFHSPSATRMALASKTKASIRLCDQVGIHPRLPDGVN